MDWVFSSFQEEIKRGIDHYSRDYGIEFAYLGVGNMSQTDPEALAKQVLFDLISERDFEGAIVVTTSLVNFGGRDALAERMRALRMPIVSIGPSLIGEDCVSIDNAAGMRQIVEHLVSAHGCRRIAFVSGPAANPDSAARLAAYRAVLDEAGIARDEADEYCGDFLPSSGEAAVAELLGARGRKPEAIVCANDLMATGVWTALLERGISCPDDIAITGFDDYPFMRYISNQFTTMRQPIEEMGFIAASRLDAASKGKAPAGPVKLAPLFRVRASCGCVETHAPRTDGGEPSPELRKFIDRARDIVRGKDLRQGTRDLCRAWADIARRHIASGRQAYELEEVLRGARAYYNGPEADKDAEALINALHTTLLDECSQAAFAYSWKERYFSEGLCWDLDALESSIGSDLCLSSHAESFDAIAERCKARVFYVASFAESGKPADGATTIYARDDRGAEWKPSADSYFPRGRGNIATNMLIVDERKYGYFILDSDSPSASAFDYLRIRLSGILKNHRIMDEDRRINEDMMREIVARADSERRLKEALALVEQLSIKDELTGLSNRRGFLNLAEQQVKLMRRNKSGFFVLYADLDGLKRINDAYGHADGDLALRSAAQALRECLRDSDIVARLGGDEFTALISQAMPPSIEIIEKRIAASCERASARLGKSWRVSLSIGHFHSGPDCDLGVARMLELADAELYKAKQRNRPGAEG